MKEKGMQEGREGLYAVISYNGMDEYSGYVPL